MSESGQRDLTASNKKYVETTSQLLGLCTPASRHVQLNLESEYPKYFTNLSNSSMENVSTAYREIPKLNDGEIFHGLNVNDPLLPSRRYLIKGLFSSIDNVDDLLVSVQALRKATILADMPQYEPDVNLSGVTPNRLLSILEEENGLLLKIRESFRRRLEREEAENVRFLADGREVPHLLSTWLLLNGSDESVDQVLSPDILDAFGLTNFIRMQILYFLVRNVPKSTFNLAHFILGFESADKSIINPEGCLPLIVDVLLFGLGHPSVESPVVCVEHPALGVQLYELLRALLCSPTMISRSAREYLRNERELFISLAGQVNSYLQQVSISSDQQCVALKLNEEFTTANDIHFTVFELQQKSVLFEILAIDLHEAFLSGQEQSYVKNLVNSLISSNTSSRESRIIEFLSAIDEITEQSTISRLKSSAEGEFQVALISELEMFLSSYVESLTILIGKILTVLHHETEEFETERELLVSSLQVWLWKFMQKSTLSSTAIESLIQLTILTSNDSGGCSFSVNALEAHISVLLKPDICSTGRCFLFSSLMRQDSEYIINELPEDLFFKLVELTVRDASLSIAGDVNDSLVTVALSLLEYLHRARPELFQDAIFGNKSISETFPYIVSSAITSTTPFIPSLLDSIIIDDSICCTSILNSDREVESLSVFLKWRAKWSLLLNLISDIDTNNLGSISNHLVDVGVFETVIYKLRCFSLPVAYRFSDQAHLVLTLILPVLKFISTLGTSDQRLASVASRLLILFKNSDILETMAVIVNNHNDHQSNEFMHISTIHCIMVLLNEGLSNCQTSQTLSTKLASIRHAVFGNLIRSSWRMHRLGKLCCNDFIPNSEIFSRLIMEIQVLVESVDLLTCSFDSGSLDSSSYISSDFNVDNVNNNSSSISLGSLVFLLNISIKKLQECRDLAELLVYLSNHFETISSSDVKMLFDGENENVSIDNEFRINERIDQLKLNIVIIQNYFIQLFEKTALFILKILKSRLSSITAPVGLSTTMYFDPRSPQVQVARSLKSDSEAIILPLLDAYQNRVQLFESFANSSLYMNSLVSDFFNLLSKNSIIKNAPIEL